MIPVKRAEQTEIPSVFPSNKEGGFAVWKRLQSGLFLYHSFHWRLTWHSEQVAFDQGPGQEPVVPPQWLKAFLPQPMAPWTAGSFFLPSWHAVRFYWHHLKLRDSIWGDNWLHSLHWWSPSQGFPGFSSAVRQMPGDLCTVSGTISLSPYH